MGTLFLITTKRAPYLHQNINLLLSRDPNALFPSLLNHKNLQELKKDIYEKSTSDQKRQANTFMENDKESSSSGKISLRQNL